MTPRRRPSITVVVAVLNRATVVGTALDSVLGQTSAPELVVIDGGSTDGTVAVIKARAAGITFWQSRPDAGIFDAWNQGLAKASGDWILFLGSDDRLTTPTALAEVQARLTQAPAGTRIAYARCHYAGTTSMAANQEQAPMSKPWAELRSRFLQGTVGPTPAFLFHRSLFHETGGFDTKFRIAGDYEMVLREAKTRDLAFLDVDLVEFGPGGISWGLEQQPAVLREVRKARQLHGLRSFAWRWHRRWLSVHLRLLVKRGRA